MAKAKPRRLGRPHHRYARVPSTVEACLRHILDGILSLRELNRRYAIPVSTLSEWKRNLAFNPDYNPIHEDQRGKHRRIFTDAEESQIANHIRTNFIQKKLLFTDADFVDVVCDFHRQFRAGAHFEPSNGFIYDFKRRNGFSSRRGHFKRRPTVDQETARAFRDYVHELMATRDLSRIINCDETSWKLYPNGILTWAETGAEDVSVGILGDEKECLTVLASVTADGRKLPLYFLAKGKTTRVESSQLGSVNYHWKNHSENGWMTEDTFSTYLMHLSECYGGQEIDLICDLHKSHHTDQVKMLAQALNINLHYIPAGCTDAMQPCDRRVFGALKGTAKLLFRRRYRSDPSRKMKKPEAVQCMLHAWDNLEAATIEEGWSCYF